MSMDWHHTPADKQAVMSMDWHHTPAYKQAVNVLLQPLHTFREICRCVCMHMHACVHAWCVCVSVYVCVRACARMFLFVGSIATRPYLFQTRSSSMLPLNPFLGCSVLLEVGSHFPSDSCPLPCGAVLFKAMSALCISVVFLTCPRQ